MSGLLNRSLIYSIRNIRQDSYEFPRELKPCSWYFWTVRARVKLDGIMRVIEWAGTYETELIIYSLPDIRRGHQSFLTEDVRLYHFYFPIRTPADAANPDFWNQKLDL